MADRPFDEPLPADLPEDWTADQIIAPEGVDVGLSEQHGYNYLMAAVNRAQRAAKAINESFDTISGKRTCRVTVGTSAAGWTQADCDYLCDGTDDQEELTQAFAEMSAKGGGELVLLAGEYHLGQPIEVPDKAAISGNGQDNTRLIFSSDVLSGSPGCAVQADQAILRDLSIQVTGSGTYTAKGVVSKVSGFGTTLFLKGVGIYQYGSTPALYCSMGGVDASNCRFYAVIAAEIYTTIEFSGSTFLKFVGNQMSGVGEIYLHSGENNQIPNIFIQSNYCPMTSIVVEAQNCGAICNNLLGRIEVSLPNSSDISLGGTILGNSFEVSARNIGGPCITLGTGTSNIFVSGNNQFDSQFQKVMPIVDNGTGNIVRFNSDDTSSGGGGITGVSSFKGRSGAVVPQTGDYTAAMVGAIPTGAVTAIQTVTQAQYDALATKGTSTLYLIKE